MIKSKVSGGNAFAAELKIGELQKLLLKIKALDERLKKMNQTKQGYSKSKNNFKSISKIRSCLRIDPIKKYIL